MFIIDFDDTLFDTFSFKSSRQKILATLGVSVDDYQKTYQDAYGNNEECVYSDFNHAESLAKLGFSKEKVWSALKSITDNSSNFLQKDAIQFLKKIKDKYNLLILLSRGNPEFQEAKIIGSGIKSFFDKIILSPKRKKDEIGELVNNYNSDIWFINDKAEETVEIVNKFPQIKAVLVASPNVKFAKYDKNNFPLFNSLSELTEYVSK